MNKNTYWREMTMGEIARFYAGMGINYLDLKTNFSDFSDSDLGQFLVQIRKIRQTYCNRFIGEQNDLH